MRIFIVKISDMRNQDLSMISKTDKVMIFYGEDSDSMSIDEFSSIQKCPAEITFKKIAASTDGVEYMVMSAFEIGILADKNPSCEMIFIRKKNSSDVYKIIYSLMKEAGIAYSEEESFEESKDSSQRPKPRTRRISAEPAPQQSRTARVMTQETINTQHKPVSPVHVPEPEKRLHVQEEKTNVPEPPDIFNEPEIPDEIDRNTEEEGKREEKKSIFSSFRGSFPKKTAPEPGIPDSPPSPLREASVAAFPSSPLREANIPPAVPEKKTGAMNMGGMFEGLSDEKPHSERPGRRSLSPVTSKNESTLADPESEHTLSEMISGVQQREEMTAEEQRDEILKARKANKEFDNALFNLRTEIEMTVNGTIDDDKALEIAGLLSESTGPDSFIQKYMDFFEKPDREEGNLIAKNYIDLKELAKKISL